MTFRFDEFADAASAQTALDAAFPVGSQADPMLQALVDMGAQCKSSHTGKVACRYVEKPGALAGWYWHVAVDVDGKRMVQRVNVSLVALGM